MIDIQSCCTCIVVELPSHMLQVIAPDGNELWQSKRVSSESHFNVKAAGPGAYKIW
jgi:hypothetical protein